MSGNSSSFLTFGSEIVLFLDDESPGVVVPSGIPGFATASYELTQKSKMIPRDYSNCLFRVHPAMQYASQSALKEALIDEDDGELGASVTEKANFLDFLRGNAENERILNQRTLTNNNGQNVVYGMTIQLQHVSSGLYLSLNTRRFSQIEKDNVEVVFSSGGSGSWLTVLPRYKIRSEGERVYINDAILFRNPESQLFVHRSKGNLLDNDQRVVPLFKEVNASLTGTAWSVRLFSEFDRDGWRNIQLGAVVRLFHPELEANLAVVEPQLGAGRGKDATPERRVARSNTILQPGATVVPYSAAAEAQNVTLLRESAGATDKVMHAGSLWRVESLSRVTGGAVGWDSAVLLRHVVSGMYLSRSLIPVSQTINAAHQQQQQQPFLGGLGRGAAAKLASQDSASYLVELSGDPESAACQFQIAPTSRVEGRAVENGSSFHLQQVSGPSSTPLWLHTAAMVKHDEAPLQAHPHRPIALVYSTERYEKDALRIIPAPPDAVADVIFVKSLLPSLEGPVLKLSEGEKLSRKDCSDIIRVLTSLVFFTLGQEQSGAGGSEEDSVASAAAATASSSSTISSSLLSSAHASTAPNLLATLADTPPQLGSARSAPDLGSVGGGGGGLGGGARPAAPVRDPMTVGGVPIRRRQSFIKEVLIDLVMDLLILPFHDNEWGSALYQLVTLEKDDPGLFHVCRLAYRLLILSFRDMRENQMYVARWLDVVVMQLGYNLLAEDCLTELLKDNRDLLEVIDEGTVRIFLDLLSRKGKDAKYINFLAALCSCGGAAIEANQERLCTLLLRNRKTADELLMPVRLSDDGRVSITWAELMNRWVTLHSFAESESTRGLRAYFESLLVLLAQMCLGRNYDVITMVEPLFSQKLVYACMQDGQLPSSTRSAFTTLMLHLYIDRDEQAPVQVPSLTRIWATLSEDLPMSEDPDKFNYIEEFVSGYLGTTSPQLLQRDSEMTIAILSMLQSLLVFGSLNSVDEVREQLTALLQAFRPLDPRGLSHHPHQKKLQPLAPPSPLPDLVRRPPQDSREVEMLMLEMTPPAGSTNNNLVKKGLKPAGSVGRLDLLDLLSMREGELYPNNELTLPAIKAKLQMCELLAHVSRLRVDYRLSKLLTAFKAAVTGAGILSKGGEPVSQAPVELVARMMRIWEDLFVDERSCALDLEVISPDTPVTAILFDMLMYDSPELSTAALTVMMRERSQRSDLLVALRSVQLLNTDSASAVFEGIRTTKLVLKHLAETEELWKADPDRSRSSVATLLERLEVVTALCVAAPRSRAPMVQNQVMLRNLAVHENVIALLGLPNDDEEFRYRPIFVACYDFLRAFCRGNEVNQALLHARMDLFLEHVSGELGVPALLCEIFRDNEALVGRADGEFISYVCGLFARAAQPDPEFLNLLSVLVQAGGTPIRANQNAVIQAITAPSLRPAVERFLFAGEAGLLEREALVAAGDLHRTNSALQCHIALLELMARCSGGANYICEAICQSLLSLDDAVAGALSARCPVPVAVGLLNFIEHVYFDVEVHYTGLAENPRVEQLVETCTAMMAQAVADPAKLAQDRDWAVMVVEGAAGLLASYLLFVSPLVPHHFHSRERRRRAAFHEACRALTSSTKANLRPSHLSLLLAHGGAAAQSPLALDKARLAVTANLEASASAPAAVGAGGADTSVVSLPTPSSSPATERHAPALLPRGRPAQGYARLPSAERPIAFFEDYVATLGADDGVREAVRGELQQLVRDVKRAASLPRVGQAPLTVTSVTQRLVTYCMDNSRSPVVPDVLRVLQEMVNIEPEGSPERAAAQVQLMELGAMELVLKLTSEGSGAGPGAGASVSVAADGAAEASALFSPPSFSSSAAAQRGGGAAAGGGSLSDLSPRALLEAYRLGNALLHDGNATVQDRLYAHLVDTKDNSFFWVLKDRMRAVVDLIKEKWTMATSASTRRKAGGAGGGGGGADDVLQGLSGPIKMLEVMLRLLQLCCEGHHAGMQNYMRSQPLSSKSVNLIAELVDLWMTVERFVNPATIGVAIQLFQTLIEFVQGPCVGNQEALVDTKIVESVNRVVRAGYRGCAREEVDELKTSAVQMLVSLLEARTDLVLHDRLISTLDIKTLASQLPRVVKRAALEGVEVPEMGYTTFILLRTLADHDPAVDLVFDPHKAARLFKTEADLTEYRAAYELFSRSTGALEILKDGENFRVYFRVPAMCALLTEASKKELVWSVRRDTPSDKVNDFFLLSDDLIAEMAYQKNLQRSSVARWLGASLETLKLVAFAVAVILNIVMISSYTAVTGVNDTAFRLPDPTIPAHSYHLINALGILLLVIGVVILGTEIVQFGPLIIRKGWKERRKARALKAD